MRLLKRISLLLLLFVSNCLLFGEEYHTFVNDDGRTLEAQILDFDSKKRVVNLEMRDGRKINADLDAFSLKDQSFIKEWWGKAVAEKQVLHEDARLRINVKLNRKSKTNDRSSYYSSHFDDETKAYFPEIEIENGELTDFIGNKIRVVLVAEDLRYTDRRLIVSAKTLQSDLTNRSKTYLESDPFRLRLYEYDSNYSTNYDYKYGYEYVGFIVIIQNSKGLVTHTRATKSRFLSNLNEMLSCKTGDIYDEDLNYKLDLRPSSYFVR